MKATPDERRPVSRRIALAMLGAACALQPQRGAAQASASPIRNVRIVCASPPGGTPDVILRHYATLWPGSVVVDNRPGAAGFVAVAALMQAAPDGTTMLLGHGGLLTLNPFLFLRLPYALGDLVPVSLAAETAFGFAIGQMVPEGVRDIAAFADWARTNPAQAQFGSPLVGTLAHVLGLMLARDAGCTLSHVPYQGGPQVISDLLGSRLAAGVLPEGLLRPMHEAGKLRVLATSGAARSSTLPAVPTLVEQGFARLVISEWFGFFLPRGASESVASDASQIVRAAAASPTLLSVLREVGLQAVASTPIQLDERIARERAFWRDNAAATGVRIG